MAAVAAAAVLAGLAGWLLAGVSNAPPQQHPAGPSTVQVNASSLAGQPVSTVVLRLRQLGLRPRVQWAYGKQQAPGTVVSVQPAGQVPPGSITVVTAAFQPPGDRPTGGKGQGNNGD